jgi:hypothetical protein
MIFTRSIIYQVMRYLLNKSKSRNTLDIRENLDSYKTLRERKKTKTPFAMPDCISSESHNVHDSASFAVYVCTSRNEILVYWEKTLKKNVKRQARRMY